MFERVLNMPVIQERNKGQNNFIQMLYLQIFASKDFKGIFQSLQKLYIDLWEDLIKFFEELQSGKEGFWTSLFW